MPSIHHLPASRISRGTAVLTLRGARAVETLRRGDRVVTRSGACTLRAIRRLACDGYGLEFDQPQIVLLTSDRVRCDTEHPGIG